MPIKIKLIEGGKAPVYKTKGAACADCYARLDKPFVIASGTRELIPLGFALELPEEFEAVIRPRSGLSRSSIDVMIGTIDCDYRNEVMANVVNNSGKDFTVNNQDRICQLKIQKAKQFNFEIVDELTDTERGLNGFGSTGLN